MLTSEQTYQVQQFLKQEIDSGALDFDSLLNGKLDGFVVPDFLNEVELSSILKAFKSLTEEELIHIHGGFNTYPISFAQFEQALAQNKINEKSYFDFSEQYINKFAGRFGVDIYDKMRSLFACMQHAPSLQIPANKDNSGRYIPFTFRELFAGEGCLKAHCENLFLHEFPDFFNRINTFSTPDNQLSFFIVLQAPGKGGELTLFDLLWNDAQRRPNDNEVILEDGRKLAFDDTQNLKRDSIPTAAGSLVIFSGGKIWHRVETVTQAPSRITLGGFLSFSHNQTNFYCWS